jgi:hypothetical protein
VRRATLRMCCQPARKGRLSSNVRPDEAPGIYNLLARQKPCFLQGSRLVAVSVVIDIPREGLLRGGAQMNGVLG